MSLALSKVVSQALLLPLNFLLLLLLALLLLTFHHRKLGSSVLAFCVAGITLLSMPIVAHHMIRTLETEPAVTAFGSSDAQAIVVLGGGINRNQAEFGMNSSSEHTLERLRYAAYLYKQEPLPVVVTGNSGLTDGETVASVMQRELTDFFGIPADQIIVEPMAATTAENARYSWDVLHKKGITRIALVTNAWHMPRSKRSFERAGFNVIAAPTVFHDLPTNKVLQYLPEAKSLYHANIALHEWIGMWWYDRSGT